MTLATKSAAFSHKRPHRKSRNGCQQCKQAKIKCDECKPFCGRCSRFQNRCSFVELQPNISPASRTSALSSPTSPPPVGLSDSADDDTPNPSEALPTVTRIDSEVNNLELLHFYTTSTSLTLSSRPELQQIWQQAVPQIAFKNLFLLHAILAFTALHIAHLQPERKGLLHAEAAAHHNTGLRLFRDAMANITPENCDACFTFSSLVAAYAWASSDQHGNLFFSDAATSETDSSVEWISLLRGVHTLLRAAGEWMTSGPMQSLLRPRQMDPELARVLDAEAIAKLTALSKLWNSTPGKFDSEDMATLNEALSLLREAHGLVASAAVDRDIDVILVVYGWPIQAPESFFTMVKEERPEALVVLAHYSLLLNKVDHFWYMQGMSRRLLQTINSKLSKEWECWIAWPLQNLILTEFRNHGERINS
ncbi:uncharacterized protein HMPREF1541_09718 [Cyphellophora europaea CBS 101466]|uniref:Zn(2)-C6 fungal-type domain-containing protein n=1 Tax=Cyphellophora europaea (strain CBS 101466) TaxID=1220924 RepID=W2S9Y8_CYPE1|nr:uncharacterized protein HMPREF1541_09718 [Cyphellophora europaea CBS 101466]ETN44843.1 hypothetical protein HMPREF1541_09718 [Cyphellophora europaea CBS 101466]